MSIKKQARDIACDATVEQIRKRIRIAADRKKNGETYKQQQTSKEYVKRIYEKAVSITEEQLCAKAENEEKTEFHIIWKKDSSKYEVSLLRELVEKLNKDNLTVLPVKLHVRDPMNRPDYHNRLTSIVMK